MQSLRVFLEYTADSHSPPQDTNLIVRYLHDPRNRTGGCLSKSRRRRGISSTGASRALTAAAVVNAPVRKHAGMGGAADLGHMPPHGPRSFEARAVAPFSRHRGRNAPSSAAAVPAAPSQSAWRLPGVDDDGGLSSFATAAAMWLGAPFVWYVALFDTTFFFNFRSLRVWMSEFTAGRAARCDGGAQPTQT